MWFNEPPIIYNYGTIRRHKTMMQNRLDCNHLLIFFFTKKNGIQQQHAPVLRNTDIFKRPANLLLLHCCSLLKLPLALWLVEFTSLN